jgi:hypothetical protein
MTRTLDRLPVAMTRAEVATMTGIPLRTLYARIARLGINSGRKVSTVYT